MGIRRPEERSGGWVMVQAKAQTLILEGPFKIRTHLLRMEEGAGDVVGVTPEGVHLPSLALWTWGE